MRRLFIASIMSVMLFGQAQAQDIDDILRGIEANNAALRAQEKLDKAQRLEAKAGNMPEGPEVEYMHSWQKGGGEPVSEINVTQGFDFPSAYFARRKAALAREEQLGHELNAFRQELLLEAKLLCIDIIALRQECSLLHKRAENSHRMARAMSKALEKGEVSSLEKKPGRHRMGQHAKPMRIETGRTQKRARTASKPERRARRCIHRFRFLDTRRGIAV